MYLKMQNLHPSRRSNSGVLAFHRLLLAPLYSALILLHPTFLQILSVQAANDPLLQRAFSRLETYLLKNGEISALADRPTLELFNHLPLYHRGQLLSEEKRRDFLNSRNEFSDSPGKSNLSYWNRNSGAGWKNIYPAHEMGNASKAAGGADADGGTLLGGSVQYHRLEQEWTTKSLQGATPMGSSLPTTAEIVHAYTVQLGNGRTKANGMPMEPPKIFAVLDPLDNYQSVREWWLNPSPVYEDASKNNIISWENPVQVGRLQAEWVDEEGNAVWPYEQDDEASTMASAGEKSGSGSGSSSGSGRSSPSPEDRFSSPTTMDSDSTHSTPGQGGAADYDSTSDDTPSTNADSPSGTTSDSEDDKDADMHAQDAAAPPKPFRVSDSSFDAERESKLILQKAAAVKLEWHWYHVSRKKINPFTGEEQEIKGLELLRDELQPGNPLRDHKAGYLVPWTYAVKKGEGKEVRPAATATGRGAGGAGAEVLSHGGGRKEQEKPESSKDRRSREFDFDSPVFEPPIPGVDTFGDGAIMFRGRLFTCWPKPSIAPESTYYWHSRILAHWFERHNGISPAATKTSCKWLPHIGKEKKRPHRIAQHQVGKPARGRFPHHHDRGSPQQAAEFLFRKRLHTGEYKQSDSASRFWDAPSLEQLYLNAPTKGPKSDKDELLREPKPFIWRKILYFNEIGRFTASSGDAGSLASSLEGLLLQKIRGQVPNPTGVTSDVDSQLAVLEPKMTTKVFTETGIPAAMRRIFVLDGVWNPWYSSRGLALGGLQANAYDQSGDATFAHLKDVRLFGRPVSVEFFGSVGMMTSSLTCASDALFFNAARAKRNYKHYGGKESLSVRSEEHGVLVAADNLYGYSISATMMQLAQTLFGAPPRQTRNELSFVPAAALRGGQKSNFWYLVSDGNYDWRPGPTQFHMFAGAALGSWSRSLANSISTHQQLQSEDVRVLKGYQVEENFLCAPSVLCAELHGILFGLRALKEWLEQQPRRVAKRLHQQSDDTDGDSKNNHKPTTRIPLLTDSSRAVELLEKYFKYGFQLRREAFFHDVPESNKYHYQADPTKSPQRNFEQVPEAAARSTSFLAGQQGLLAYRGMLRTIAGEWMNLLENEKVLVFFHWVPSHAGFLPNELVDSAAAKLRSVARAVGRTTSTSPTGAGLGDPTEEQKAIAEECPYSGGAGLDHAFTSSTVVPGVVRACSGSVFREASFRRMWGKQSAERHGRTTDGGEPRSCSGEVAPCSAPDVEVGAHGAACAADADANAAGPSAAPIDEGEAEEKARVASEQQSPQKGQEDDADVLQRLTKLSLLDEDETKVGVPPSGGSSEENIDKEQEEKFRLGVNAAVNREPEKEGGNEVEAKSFEQAVQRLRDSQQSESIETRKLANLWVKKEKGREEKMQKMLQENASGSGQSQIGSARMSVTDTDDLCWTAVDKNKKDVRALFDLDVKVVKRFLQTLYMEELLKKEGPAAALGATARAGEDYFRIAKDVGKRLVEAQKRYAREDFLYRMNVEKSPERRAAQEQEAKTSKKMEKIWQRMKEDVRAAQNGESSSAKPTKPKAKRNPLDTNIERDETAPENVDIPEVDTASATSDIDMSATPGPGDLSHSLSTSSDDGHVVQDQEATPTTFEEARAAFLRDVKRIETQVGEMQLQRRIRSSSLFPADHDGDVGDFFHGLLTQMLRQARERGLALFEEKASWARSFEEELSQFLGGHKQLEAKVAEVEQYSDVLPVVGKQKTDAHALHEYREAKENVFENSIEEQAAWVENMVKKAAKKTQEFAENVDSLRTSLRDGANRLMREKKALDAKEVRSMIKTKETEIAKQEESLKATVGGENLFASKQSELEIKKLELELAEYEEYLRKGLTKKQAERILEDGHDDEQVNELERLFSGMLIEDEEAARTKSMSVLETPASPSKGRESGGSLATTAAAGGDAVTTRAQSSQTPAGGKSSPASTEQKGAQKAAPKKAGLDPFQAALRGKASLFGSSGDAAKAKAKAKAAATAAGAAARPSQDVGKEMKDDEDNPQAQADPYTKLQITAPKSEVPKLSDFARKQVDAVQRRRNILRNGGAV